MKRLFAYLIAAIVAVPCLLAQELRCTVQINHDQVASANQQNFQQLQQDITEFLNTTKWTNLSFAEQERIECQIMIVCKSVSDAGMYQCETTVQASRPVYNTSYTTPLINIKDNNFTFTWNQEPLNFQLNSYESNLPCLLGYYAYLILGMDADSYQRLGGSPYFQMCERIVNLCQTASMEDAEQTGWRAFERNPNRYSFTNNVMDEAFSPFRGFYYEYHRLSLDAMEANVGNARARIADGLKTVQDAKKARMNNYIVTVFLDTKVDELINIFHGSQDPEKTEVYEMLTNLDPTRSNQYERINE